MRHQPTTLAIAAALLAALTLGDFGSAAWADSSRLRPDIRFAPATRRTTGTPPPTPPTAPTDQAVADAHKLLVADVPRLRSMFKLTNAEILSMSRELVARHMRKLGTGMVVRDRAAFFNMLKGHLAAGASFGDLLEEAYRNVQRQQADAARPRAVAGVPVQSTTGGPSPWRNRGSGQIGGRVRAILPLSADSILLGSAGGGLWRTDNGGGSWSPVDTFRSNLVVSHLAADPSNPLRIYAATGEIGAMDSLRGAGIFTSADGGRTWLQIPTTNSSDFHAVTRIAVSQNGSVILAATNVGLFRREGATAAWTRALGGPGRDVRFDPTNPAKALATFADGRVFYTENSGNRWAAATTPWTVRPGMTLPPIGMRVELAYARANPLIVYASVDNANAAGASLMGEVWKSINGGQRFSPVSTGTRFLGGQGWYANTIWAGDPHDANFVLVGGLDLYRSTQGGTNLTQISRWQNSPVSAHADHHVIVAHKDFGTRGHPAANTVFFGNDGGIYKAANVRTVEQLNGWTALNNSLNITQFHKICANGARIVGGAQDNGTVESDPPSMGEGNWRPLWSGDGGHCAISPTSASPSRFFGSYVHSRIFRQDSAAYHSGRYITGTNGSGLQPKAPPFIVPDSAPSAPGAEPNSLFIAPFVADPVIANRLLTGGLSLWRTNDAHADVTDTAGPSWVAIKPPHHDPSGSHISSIAIHPTNSRVVWVCHRGGAVFKTENATTEPPVGASTPMPTWTRVDTAPVAPFSRRLPARLCSSVVIDSVRANRVVVGFSGFENDNIWMTDDNGATWRSLAPVVTLPPTPTPEQRRRAWTSFPAVPVYALALHPRNPSFIYAGTEVGLFVSADSGATWYASVDGPANTAIFDLKFASNTLVVATHGRGAWTIDIPAP